jgi:hypothetical protein
MIMVVVIIHNWGIRGRRYECNSNDSHTEKNPYK